MQHPNIAVVGSGYWGKNLVRNYHQLGVLKLICDKNETTLSLFSEQYPGIETCIAFNEVLQNDEIEGVVIATVCFTRDSTTNSTVGNFSADRMAVTVSSSRPRKRARRRNL